jgi:chitinase
VELRAQIALIALARVAVFCGCFALAPTSRADLWVTAYYAGWNQAYLPPSQIDFGAVSHVIHFSLVPNSDGSLNADANVITPAYSSNLVAHAHAAGRKVLICVGGASSQTGFQGAASAAKRSTFISNLVNFMSTYGYDGIDLDWEPLPVSDSNGFTNLVNGLRSALNAFSPAKLLTAAAGAYSPSGDPPNSQYPMFASLQNQFDQINVMTYDLAGPYPGWVTWFNAAIYDAGYHFPSTGGLILSAAGSLTNFINNGVAPGKLAIGMAFYGVIWAGGAGTTDGGATQPRQSWTSAPTTSQITYYDLMSTYYQSNIYHWDTAAQAAYLSINNTGSASDKFISYDDEHTCQAKVSYARNHHLGGVMIWELGSGYRSTQPVGQRESLLQSVKQSLNTPRITALEVSGQDIRLTFTSLPLGLYRAQWTSNLLNGPWMTLTNNVPGTNGSVQVFDPGAALSQAQRFYRVQTPP